MDLSAFPTPRPALNVILLVSASLSILLLLRQLLKALVYWIRQEHAFWGVPTEPVANYLYGHAPFVVDSGKGLRWLTACCKKRRHSKMLHLRTGPFNYLVLHHPDTAKVFLGSEPKLEITYFPLYPWLGESVLTGSGPKWQRTRRLLTPSFHFAILKPYVKVFSECTDVLLNKWSAVPEGEVVECFESISLLTLDVMLRCTCSFQSNCQEVGTHNQYIRSVYTLSRLFHERIIYFPYYWDLVYFSTKKGREFLKACEIVHRFSMDVIKKRRKELEEASSSDMTASKGRRYLDFIDTLLEAKDENGVGMTDEEIRAEVDTFMFEGHDTTASGISWTLYNLATHPEHQAKCHDEVDAFFDSLDSDTVTWDDVSGDNCLEYLTMCLKESMRIYPPVPVIARRITKETVFDGRTMPAGTMTVLPVYVLHRHPGVWENPEEYDPLRFTKVNSEGRSPYAFVPFSAGPRNCIGQQFALKEEKVVLAKILRQFDLSADTANPPEMMATLITRAKNGIFLKLKKRSV